MHITSYPKVYALGHRDVVDILEGDYYVEEKIDGSQISFTIGDNDDRELSVRSRGSEIVVGFPDKMFAPGVEVIKSLPLIQGLIYRGEYLAKPKHNCLVYGRVPEKHIIIFNIEDAHGNPLPRKQTVVEAQRIGLEHVPMFDVKMDSLAEMKAVLEKESCLGGTKIEGIVIKNPAKTTDDKKYMVAKFVSEQFKERQTKDWRAQNPTGGDIVNNIILSLRTDARFNKAIQHLKEAGTFTGSPQDIGSLLKELHADIEAEEQDWIKAQLYNHFIKQIKRGVCGGFPEWYKLKLAEEAFGK